MPRSAHPFPEIRLSLFGPLLLERDGKAVAVRRRRAQTLLAFLTLNRQPQAREKIATLFWGDSTDDQARLSLRVTLNALRQALHPELVLADRETIQLHPEIPLWVDTAEFERVARHIRRLPVNSDVNALTEALSALNARYRGEFMLGQSDDWILVERERFRTLYLEQLLTLTNLFRAAGDYTRAVGTARQVLFQDPANEQAHQHLIVCLATLGDRTAALAQFETAVRALREELGVEPSAETFALVERIARQSVGGSPAAPLTNVPSLLTRFYGREKEMREVRELLEHRELRDGQLEQTRLVTLTGVGGTGKTRLAIQLGRALVDNYPDGVWWVELAPISDEALVSQALAKTIGVPEEADRTPIERLADYMRERTALIVLDNCEHLLAECARVVQALAGACPYLQFLATSRETLALAGEYVYAVPKLGTPELRAGDSTSIAALLDYASVRLLVERAGHAPAAFQLNEENGRAIAQICRQLDGIPLALEIAAAQLKLMSAGELAARLDERLQWVSDTGAAAPARQQTLRALFDWSFERLTVSERTLFRRLAVFRGGLDAAAAMAVAYGEIDTAAPLDELGTTPQQIVSQLLNALHEKSLLVLKHTPHGARYELLETLRAFAQEKLGEANERAQIESRHLAHFDALAELASRNYYTPEQVKWLDHLEWEHANLRAALAFADASGAVETQVHLSAYLGTFWQLRNYWTEGREWLRLTLERARDMPPSPLLARVYGSAGVMDWLQGDYERALTRHDRALELYRYLEDPAGIANSLNNVALQYQGLGRYAEARALYDEALVLAKEAEHPRLILRMLNNLSSITYLLGDFDASDSYSEQALTRARDLGEKYALAVALANRAQIVMVQNDHDRALAYSDEIYQVAHELGNQEFMSEGLRHKAMVYLRRQEFQRAVSLFRQSLGWALDLGAKRQMIWSMEGLAMACAGDAGWRVATRLFASAARLRERTAIPLDAIETADHAALRATLETALGAEQFAVEWADGQARATEEVIAEGLGV